MGRSFRSVARSTALARRLIAGAIGFSAGLAAGSMLANANVTALAAAIVFAAAAILIARALTPPPFRSYVYLVVALAIALRYAAATLLYDGLTVMGRGGFVTGDDGTYADLSWRIVRLWRGELADFSYSGESYLLGTYVYLESLVFAVVGPNVLVVQLLNGALGGALVALVHDITRRLFVAPRAALATAVLVALYPSLVLWSALNLKDSLALILIATVLWLLALFAERRAVWLIPLMYVPVVLMLDLRSYIFICLTFVIPVSVFLAPRKARRWSVVGVGCSLALSGLLLITYVSEWTTLSTSTLATLEHVRDAMGIGARTRIVDVPVVQDQEVQTYTVPGTLGSPAAVPAATSSTSVVVVGPGDIVVSGSAFSPAHTEERVEPPTRASSGAVELGSNSGSALALRTLRYLPVGLAFALLAPFPWAIERPLDVLPIPEMLLWYVCLVAGSIVLLRERRRWRVLAPSVLFIVGALVVLALAEGNVGTLYRHRAMVIPFVIVTAAPGLVQLFDKVRSTRVGLPHRRDRRATLGTAVGR